MKSNSKFLTAFIFIELFAISLLLFVPQHIDNRAFIADIKHSAVVSDDSALTTEIEAITNEIISDVQKTTNIAKEDIVTTHYIKFNCEDFLILNIVVGTVTETDSQADNKFVKLSEKEIWLTPSEDNIKSIIK